MAHLQKIGHSWRVTHLNAAFRYVEKLGLSIPGTKSLNVNFVLNQYIDIQTMKFTQTTLDKIESVLDEAEYVLRYERGNFQSGYCILEQRKVVVLNKFLQLEGRINTLIDLVPQLNVSPDIFSAEVRKIYEEVLEMHALANTKD